MSTLDIPTAKVFRPLLEPARYKGGYGGRGSGKSHFFGELLVEDALRFPGDAGIGLSAVCVREVQKTLAQSAKKLIEGKIQKFGLKERDGFKIYKDCIAFPNDGICIFQGLQDHTAESIKSLEGFQRLWGEEAQTIKKASWDMVRPTIRWEDKNKGLASEIWCSWNPRRKLDPVDHTFRSGNAPTGSVCVKANWSDNPWFPDVLEQERQDCLRENKDQYEHIWEGDYVSVVDGAYFAEHLSAARKEGRIKPLAVDPNLRIRLFVDIGGTGARADAFVIWVTQFVGDQIKVLNHYEVQGQPVDAHLNWLNKNGYKPEKADIWLPHDGKTNDRVYDVSYESAFRGAGYDVTVVPNQGKGAASMRIDEARRLFPRVEFDSVKCEAGLDALGWYHEKKDEKREVGLGPEHDWASHSADAFGLMCIVYEPPRDMKHEPQAYATW